MTSGHKVDVMASGLFSKKGVSIFLTEFTFGRMEEGSHSWEDILVSEEL